jgi:ABC-type branched-subunit amino acid transport system substrate-binding protein
MKGNIRIFLIVVALVLVLSFVLPGCQQATPATTTTPSTPSVPKGPIKIGLLFDMTGPTAATNVPGQEALNDWYKYKNENGGIQGHKVELVLVDMRYDANQAVSGFEKLVNQDKVNMVITGSANLEAIIRPLMDKYKMPTMAPTEMVAHLPFSPNGYLFGTVPPYADNYRCSLTYIKDNWKKSNPPRIGIMGLDAAFSKSTVKPVKWMLENELKWPIVAEEWATMSATDVTSQVTNLKNANCDYIILASTAAPQLIFAKTAKAAGLTDQTILIDIFVTAMRSFRQLDPAATDNQWSHSPTATMEMAGDIPALTTVNQIHKTARPKAPDLDWLRIAYYGSASLMDDTFDKTITKYGYDKLTGENIKWIMEHEMTGNNAKGLLGPVPWSTTTHVGWHDVNVVKTTPNFGLEVLKKWQPMPPWPDAAKDANFWKL